MMADYLNDATVQKAIHTTGHKWVDADETGPVADALRSDFTNTVMPQVD